MSVHICLLLSVPVYLYDTVCPCVSVWYCLSLCNCMILERERFYTLAVASSPSVWNIRFPAVGQAKNGKDTLDLVNSTLKIGWNVFRTKKFPGKLVIFTTTFWPNIVVLRSRGGSSPDNTWETNFKWISFDSRYDQSLYFFRLTWKCISSSL